MQIAALVALMAASAVAGSAEDAERCKPPEGTRPFDFSFGENNLRGFVDVPEGTGPFATVLILHGSGDTDIFSAENESTRYYDQLRDTFRAAGVATAIWDKAGSGCSTGKYSNGNPIRERAGETVAALKALKGRSEIDGARMGLWAISQGGWVAPMAAVRTQDVSFMILVSAPARDAVSQAEYQTLNALRSKGIEEGQVQTIARYLRRALAVMRAGGSIEEFAAAAEPLKQYPVLQELGITMGTAAEYQAWQQSMDHHYRPDTALRELRQPVLAIYGDRDVLVDWRESAEIYKESLRFGGNKDLTVKVFRNADHNLFEAGTRQLTDGYLRTMRVWLAKHVREPTYH